MSFPQLGFPQVYGVERASPPRQDGGTESGGGVVAGSPASSAAALAPLLGVYAHPWSAHRYGAFMPYSSAEAALLNHMGTQYELKENPGAHPAGFTMHTGFYPYGQYQYGDPSRAKSATRETTSTLKAWLQEHKKNPYPTKGEKIMLAIVTKMTLTQVSTWFANARRRLKKENKVTWGRSADDVEGDGDGCGYDSERDDEDAPNKHEREEEIDLETVDSDEDEEAAARAEPSAQSESAPTSPDASAAASKDASEKSVSADVSLRPVNSKPKIWSLAETATSPDTNCPKGSSVSTAVTTTHPAFLPTNGIYTCQIGKLNSWTGGALGPLIGVRSLMGVSPNSHYITSSMVQSESPTHSLSPQHNSDREHLQRADSPALPLRPSFPVIHDRSHHETAQRALKTVS
ncbi:iroquois-class homeodomain protein IRX-1b isoform X2 [Silurus meridionalis]|uniref:Homeobox domain-containing protein n=1 Tax=Silurus meridionalis TaxID=175797 RepID=A0A8T0A632_SILME|nr:iroquois-class homeodomain protein IRX-1b isoform X2 [Silurus meridionalis]KAF7686330.1 hypothetical protein HF521_015692 [Silurus meridionalis]KAI5087344.1 iroquois-class homeodomain protein IRX-1 [Silurus meridionalis]